jgi:hypothetical protein
MKRSIIISIPLALAIASVYPSSTNANTLNNPSFENGNAGWAGNALNYFRYSCAFNGTNGGIPVKEGDCFAWFMDASGTSLTQHDKTPRSGTYEASVALMGQGNVRFGLWTFCPGAAPSSYGFTSIPLTQSWQTFKVKTSPLNSCEVKWELYVDTDKQVFVDAAKLYVTF